MNGSSRGIGGDGLSVGSSGRVCDTRVGRRGKGRGRKGGLRLTLGLTLGMSHLDRVGGRCKTVSTRYLDM